MIPRAAFGMLAIGVSAAGIGTAVRAADRREGALPSAAMLAGADARAVTVAQPPVPVVQGAQVAGGAQVAQGARLFVSYNCGDCHGAGGSGAMAPSLQDNRFHFGGSPSEIFRSIAEGRPGGMPAWGAIIPGPQMVALAAYVRSLGEGRDLSTENFTGATIERSGH